MCLWAGIRFTLSSAETHRKTKYYPEIIDLIICVENYVETVDNYL